MTMVNGTLTETSLAKKTATIRAMQSFGELPEAKRAKKSKSPPANIVCSKSTRDPLTLEEYKEFLKCGEEAFEERKKQKTEGSSRKEYMTCYLIGRQMESTKNKHKMLDIVGKWKEFKPMNKNDETPIVIVIDE